MSYQKQQFGIMDQGYFVPKSEILAWINSLLQINITKVEALGSGSIYCQIFDVIHPNKINLAKVNWKAKNDTEFLANFRLLQTACQKIGIKRHIDVQKLVKAKYQDNLEFIQWLKRYFDTNCGSKGQGYDPVQKRNKVVPDFSFCQKVVVPKVYNGSGQITKEKVTSPKAKKEEEPPKPKSPKNIKTPIVTTKKTPIAPKKTQQKKEEIKKPQIKKEQNKKVEAKKPEQKKQSRKGPEIKKDQLKKTQPKTTTPVIKRPTTAIGPGIRAQQNPRELETITLKKKVKILTDNLQMIRQIVVSQQDQSDIKIELIKQVLGIENQKPETHQIIQPLNYQPQSTQQKQEEQPTVTESPPSPDEELLVSDKPQSTQKSKKNHIQQAPIQQSPDEEFLVSDEPQSKQKSKQNHIQQRPIQQSPDELHQEESQQENLLQQQGEEQVHPSESHQEESHPEQKPEISQSQIAPSEHDDDII